MGKGIMALIFTELGILLICGLALPNSPAMWLASTAIGYAFLRIALLVILGALLVTHPPRNKYFRMFVGAAAVLLAAWSLRGIYMDEMKFLDTLSVLGASISMGIVALEYEPKEALRKAKAATSKKRIRKPRTATA